MVKKKSIKNNHLKQSEKDSLHLSEFSHGKPYEFSLNVLENKSINQQEKKPSILKRLFSHDKGSSKGLPDTPYVSNGQDLFGESDKGKNTGHNTDKFNLTGENTEISEISPALENASVKVEQTGSFSHSVKDVVQLPSALNEGNSSNKVRNSGEISVGIVSQYNLDRSRKPFLDESSREEIKRRQHKRQVRGRIVIVAVAFVVVALLTVGGVFLYKEFQKQQSNIDLLKTSLSYIEESDEVFGKIDSFFQESFDDSTTDVAKSLIKEIPDAEKKLETAKDYANTAHDGLHDSTTDKEAAEYALNSIVSRETLYDVSEKRLNEDIAAKTAMDEMSEVKDSINEGNSLIVQASKVVANTTAENVNTSTQYLTSAKEYFTTAQTQLEKVKTDYPKSDVSLIENYIVKKIELCGYALTSNEAILIQDKAAAEEANKKYNQIDEEAVAIAESFSKDFNQPIIDVYQAETVDLIEQYNNARNEAARNDSNLRKYLGISV